MIQIIVYFPLKAKLLWNVSNIVAQHLPLKHWYLQKSIHQTHHSTLLPCSFKSDCFLVLKINIACVKGAKEIPTQAMKECCTSKNGFYSKGKGKEKRSTVLSSFSCRYLWHYLVTDTVARFRSLNLYYQSLIIMSLKHTAEQASPVQEFRKAFNYFWTAFLCFS